MKIVVSCIVALCSSAAHASGFIECFLQIDEAEQSDVTSFEVQPQLGSTANGEYAHYFYNAEVIKAALPGRGLLLKFRVTGPAHFELNGVGQTPSLESSHLFSQTYNQPIGQMVTFNCFYSGKVE